MPIEDSLKSRIEAANQAHVLPFMDAWEEPLQRSFVKELERIDWDLIGRLSRDENEIAANAQPNLIAASAAPAIELGVEHESISRTQAIERGEQLLRQGKVAMILVAGGQGTRLGFDKPKGLFPIGPLSDKSLFQLLIEKAVGAANFYGCQIAVLIMTSPATHEETIQYLDAHANFGLSDRDCFVFCQGTMPAIEASSRKVLLAAPGQLFASPNGHGGMLDALRDSGGLAMLRERNIDSVFYGQIDNPLLQVCDPLTLGYHNLLQSELTTQVVRKSEPLQRVGNVVSIDGQIQIIEYSDLPQDVAKQTDEFGNLKLWAGNIAVHVFQTEFLQQASQNPDALPFHRALKRVAYLDNRGEQIEPTEPNAIKFEKFIFDLLPLAKNALAIEVDARDGFAAVKNAPPASSETPASARAALVDLHKRWLDRCGVHVEPGTDIEISPLFAINEKQLAEKTVEINTVMEATYFADP